MAVMPCQASDLVTGLGSSLPIEKALKVCDSIGDQQLRRDSTSAERPVRRSCQGDFVESKTQLG